MSQVNNMMRTGGPRIATNVKRNPPKLPDEKKIQEAKEKRQFIRVNVKTENNRQGQPKTTVSFSGTVKQSGIESKLNQNYENKKGNENEEFSYIYQMILNGQVKEVRLAGYSSDLMHVLVRGGYLTQEQFNELLVGNPDLGVVINNQTRNIPEISNLINKLVEEGSQYQKETDINNLSLQQLEFTVGLPKELKGDQRFYIQPISILDSEMITGLKAKAEDVIKQELENTSNKSKSNESALDKFDRLKYPNQNGKQRLIYITANKNGNVTVGLENERRKGPSYTVTDPIPIDYNGLYPNLVYDSFLRPLLDEAAQKSGAQTLVEADQYLVNNYFGVSAIDTIIDAYNKSNHFRAFQGYEKFQYPQEIQPLVKTQENQTVFQSQ